MVKTILVITSLGASCRSFLYSANLCLLFIFVIHFRFWYRWDCKFLVYVISRIVFHPLCGQRQIHFWSHSCVTSVTDFHWHSPPKSFEPCGYWIEYFQPRPGLAQHHLSVMEYSLNHSLALCKLPHVVGYVTGIAFCLGTLEHEVLMLNKNLSSVVFGSFSSVIRK